MLALLVADHFGGHRTRRGEFAQLLDVVDRDALVEVAVQAQPRHADLLAELEPGGEPEAALGEAAAVERDRRPEGAGGGRVERDAAAPVSAALSPDSNENTSPSST